MKAFTLDVPRFRLLRALLQESFSLRKPLLLGKKLNSAHFVIGLELTQDSSIRKI